MNMQVQKEHYKFGKYLHIRRWCSYYYQVREVLEHGSKSVLLIGEGDGIVSAVLNKMPNISVTTFDFANDLKPNIVGDIREIKRFVENETFDCLICCQVLEHLEFKYFDKIIKAFSEIVKKDGTVIISLPQQKIWLKIHLNFAIIDIKKTITIPMFWKGKYKFNGEHYWEVASRGYKKKKILNCFKKYFTIEKQFTVFEFPYHWFVVLSRTN